MEKSLNVTDDVVNLFSEVMPCAVYIVLNAFIYLLDLNPDLEPLSSAFCFSDYNCSVTEVLLC